MSKGQETAMDKRQRDEIRAQMDETSPYYLTALLDAMDAQDRALGEAQSRLRQPDEHPAVITASSVHQPSVPNGGDSGQLQAQLTAAQGEIAELKAQGDVDFQNLSQRWETGAKYWHRRAEQAEAERERLLKRVEELERSQKC